MSVRHADEQNGNYIFSGLEGVLNEMQERC